MHVARRGWLHLLQLYQHSLHGRGILQVHVQRARVGRGARREPKRSQRIQATGLVAQARGERLVANSNAAVLFFEATGTDEPHTVQLVNTRALWDGTTN